MMGWIVAPIALAAGFCVGVSFGVWGACFVLGAAAHARRESSPAPQRLRVIEGGRR